MKRYRARSAMRRVLLLALVFCLLYPLIEPYWLQVESTQLTDSDLPSGIRRLRICYASDLHMAEFPFFTQSRAAGLIQEINRQNPDLIILGGDYTNSPADTLTFFQLIRDQRLPRFRASYGVYAVLGEHDRPESDAELVTLRRAAADAGVTLLMGSVNQVRIGISTITLVGVDPAAARLSDLTTLARQVASGDYVILVSHSPAVVSDALRATSSDGRQSWFNLGLFGHTHGGQVALLGGLMNISDVSGSYQRGWQTENRIPLLISNGVGTVTAPVRLLRRPQIHVITVLSN